MLEPRTEQEGRRPGLTVLPGAQRVDASEADRNEYVRAVVEELKVRVTFHWSLAVVRAARRMTFPFSVVGLAVRPDTRVHARHRRNALPWLSGALQSNGRAESVQRSKHPRLTLLRLLAAARRR